MSRTKKAVLWSLLCMTMAISGCGKKDGNKVEFQEREEESSGDVSRANTEVGEGTEMEEDSVSAERIFVHVCGCVKAPGVYELGKEARVYEALEAAGGVAENAAENELNLAERLSDGDRLYVPSAEEAARDTTKGDFPAESTPGDGKISINHASREELMSLTGIGEGRARAIVDYREENGPFSSTEELMNVEGIKEGIYNKVKDDIKL